MAYAERKLAYFAPVAPAHILEYLFGRMISSNCQLLLAHDVAANPEAYINAYNNKRRLFPSIILDNSVVELGGAVDLKMVIEAVRVLDSFECNPQVTVVLPDVYLKGPETVEAIAGSQDWRHRIGSLSCVGGFLAIPQGRTWEEWIQCAEAICKYNFSWWGVPRNIVDGGLRPSRREAVEIVNALDPTKGIHLFGFSDNIEDDLLCARMPQVNGIDSAVPVRYPHKISLTSKVGKRGDWWETAEPNSQMVENVEWVQNFISRNRSCF